MAFLPRPVTMMIFVSPAATASSMTYWMMGLSTRGSISLGCALVAGRKRVPRPAAGKTALRIDMDANATTATGRPTAHAILGDPESGSMLDLKYVAENRERVTELLLSRGQALSSGEGDLWARDAERRALIV